VSTSIVVPPRERANKSPFPTEPLTLRTLEVVVTSGVVSLLVAKTVMRWSETSDALPELVAWLVIVALADLRPVPLWGSTELMISFPVLLAAAFVFPAHVAALLSFVATVDLREFRREITPLRGLLNRSNVALSVFAAATVFQVLGGNITDWPGVLLRVAPAAAADVAINASLVILGTHLLTKQPVNVVATRVYGGEQARWFLVAYASFGLLAVLLATVYSVADSWGLIAFAIPLLLARQMFVYWRNASEAFTEVSVRQKALSEVTARISDERRDERLTLAAGIHDEVLPLLYQVHLMGEVIKRDLAGGRLLDLETDLPDLIRATQLANDALRNLIGNLRRSSIGPGGLADTLRLLVSQLESRSSARFESEIGEMQADSVVELLLYQIAREALTNAAMHARATAIRVALRAEEGQARLQIDDNGCGFEPRRVDSSRHFGLELMRERADLAGGALVVDSVLGSGTTVVVRLPLSPKTNE
jgi:signal transduction histidine kinase